MTLEQLMKMFIYWLEESVIMIESAWVIQDLQDRSQVNVIIGS